MSTRSHLSSLSLINPNQIMKSVLLFSLLFVLSECCLVKGDVIPTRSPTVYNEINGFVQTRNANCKKTKKISVQNSISSDDCADMCKKTYGCKVCVLTSKEKCHMYKSCKYVVEEQDNIMLTKYRPPEMGYSTWNFVYKNANLNEMMIQLGYMKHHGLIDAGYTIFHVDGVCTFKNKDKNGQVARDSNDNLIEPTECFTYGIKNYSNTIRENGMLVSWYTAGGAKTCANDIIRSTDKKKFKETVFRDMNMYKKWGVDRLKVDNCGMPPRGMSDVDIISHWNKMRRDVHPDLTMENCKYGCNWIRRGGKISTKKKVWEKFCPYVAESHRSFIDIRPWPERILMVTEAIALSSRDSNPTQGWAFADALEICNTDFLSNRYAYKNSINTGDINDLEIRPNGFTGASNTYELQLGMLGIWAITSQPLFISTDISHCSIDMINILKMKRLINMNQYFSGDPGTRTLKTNILGRSISRWEKKVNTLTGSYIHVFIMDDTNEQPNDITIQQIENDCPEDYNKVVLWRTKYVRFMNAMYSCEKYIQI